MEFTAGFSTDRKKPQFLFKAEEKLWNICIKAKY